MRVARSYEERFESWFTQYGIASMRQVAWLQFLDGAERGQTRTLLDRLASGTIPHHPSVVLLEAAALIESLQTDYLEATVDALRAQLDRTRLLITALAGGA
jgi:hypothetical protein